VAWPPGRYPPPAAGNPDAHHWHKARTHRRCQRPQQRQQPQLTQRDHFGSAWRKPGRPGPRGRSLAGWARWHRPMAIRADSRDAASDPGSRKRLSGCRSGTTSTRRLVSQPRRLPLKQQSAGIQPIRAERGLAERKYIQRELLGDLDLATRPWRRRKLNWGGVALPLQPVWMQGLPQADGRSNRERIRRGGAEGSQAQDQGGPHLNGPRPGHGGTFAPLCGLLKFSCGHCW